MKVKELKKILENINQEAEIYMLTPHLEETYNEWSTIEKVEIDKDGDIKLMASNAWKE